MIYSRFALEIIFNAGGTAKLASLLRVSRQRVHNWKKRGIPSKVMEEHLDTIQRLRRR